MGELLESWQQKWLRFEGQWGDTVKRWKVRETSRFAMFHLSEPYPYTYHGRFHWNGYHCGCCLLFLVSGCLGSSGTPPWVRWSSHPLKACPRWSNIYRSCMDCHVRKANIVKGPSNSPLLMRDFSTINPYGCFFRHCFTNMTGFPVKPRHPIPSTYQAWSP